MIHPTDSRTPWGPHHLQNENQNLKILFRGWVGFWTANFGSDWWIFTSVGCRCRLAFPHLLWMPHPSLTCWNVGNRLQCESENIYPPWNKHFRTWKLMVGRWTFLLGWPIFSCYVSFRGVLEFFFAWKWHDTWGSVSSHASQNLLVGNPWSRSWSPWKTRFRKSSCWTSTNKKLLLIHINLRFFIHILKVP